MEALTAQQIFSYSVASLSLVLVIVNEIIDWRWRNNPRRHQVKQAKRAIDQIFRHAEKRMQETSGKDGEAKPKLSNNWQRWL